MPSANFYISSRILSNEKEIANLQKIVDKHLYSYDLRVRFHKEIDGLR